MLEPREEELLPSPTHSPSPFSGFVCKLLGSQCHPETLLRLEKGPERPVWRTVAQSRDWHGKNRTFWAFCSPDLPQRGDKPRWAVGQGTGSLPGCLQHRGRSAPEIYCLISLLCSYLFAAWLAALQSKRDSAGRKDCCLGTPRLPQAYLGVLGRATYPLPHRCLAFWGKERCSETGMMRTEFSVPPELQKHPQGRPVFSASAALGARR